MSSPKNSSAIGRLGVGREHVEDAAAAAELAGQLDRFRVLEAVLDQPGRQLFGIDGLRRSADGGAGGKLGAVGHRLNQGLHRGQHETRRLGAFQLLEQTEPLAGDFIDRATRQPVLTEIVPGGENDGSRPAKLARSPAQPSRSRG